MYTNFAIGLSLCLYGHVAVGTDLTPCPTDEAGPDRQTRAGFAELEEQADAGLVTRTIQRGHRAEARIDRVEVAAEAGDDARTVIAGSRPHDDLAAELDTDRAA
jgi:hypothetical protein